ncbi:PEP/pyruvate-binding domain-containing protein, partial [Escherichia coli]|uniref:PEP/pyruvate-binding domain-containing protein n=1 Tax=Escherichia coli TaxID=562 RepID=UPI0028E03324
IVDPEVRSQLRAAWVDIGGEDRAVVVRSSSTIEDAGASSMAGRFTSVLDVTSWDELLSATQRVIDSADAVSDEHGERRPIAVLVQPQLDT